MIHEVHGLMHTYGMVMPTGVSTFRHVMGENLESDKDPLTPLSQDMFGKLVKELAALEEQLASYQAQLETLAKPHPECQRLLTLPGIGPITATALIAAVGSIGVLKHGRQFAAW